MSDTVRAGTWPLLLAGPMLRRVTRSEVHVFIATSKAVTDAVVVIHERRIRYDEQGVMIEFARGTPTTLTQLGDKLFVGVLSVTLPFSTTEPDDGLYSYDIELKDGSDSHNLHTLGMLGTSTDAKLAEVPLGYEPDYLPNFRLPPEEIEDLRVAHGSCRKPHGGEENEPDALAILDGVIAGSLQVLESGSWLDELPQSNQERPHQLILTGDQIYADDVAAGLLVCLTDTAETLLGWTEDFPSITSLNEVLLDPGWRTRFLSLAGIKDIPEDGAVEYSWNHLLRYGEWCAMYLFAWSDALWPRDHEDEYDLPQPPIVLNAEEVKSLLEKLEQVSGVKIFPQQYAYAKAVDLTAQFITYLTDFSERVIETWKTTRDKALGYAKTVRYVRRLLANVPTYTMFDDHEVTDDWFLNRNVTDRLLGNTADPVYAGVGPRLLRNGLSAYAIFQHWGNVPDDFATGQLGRDLLDKWTGSKASPPTLAKTANAGDADQLLGISSVLDSHDGLPSTRGEFDRMRWDYAIRFPAHRLVALDTRTWRAFPDQPKFGWATLQAMSSRPLSGDDGADTVREIAQAWQDAANDASSVAMGAWADLITACADAVQAGSATEVRTQLDAIADATTTVVQIVVPSSTERTDFLAQVATYKTSKVPAVAELADGIWSAANFLERLSRAQLVVEFEPLQHAAARLSEYLEAWAHVSYYGVAAALDALVQDAGDDLVVVFDDIAGLDPTVSLRLAIGEVGATVEALLDDIGVDEVSEKLFRDGTNRMGAALISRQALEFQVTTALKETGPSIPTLLLSPAPIFGHKMVEIAQRVALIRDTTKGKPGAEEQDYEAWTVNMPALNDLIEAAREVDRCVVLSGDVHYANSSVNEARLPRRTDPTLTVEERKPCKARYIQLTSSSSRNADAMTRGLGLLDDILWDEDDRLQVIQWDYLVSLTPWSEGDPDDPSLGGYYLEVAEEKLNDLADTAWHMMRDAATYAFVPGALVIKLWTERAKILDYAGRLAHSPIDTVEALSREAIWKLTAASRMTAEFFDDPAFAMFGEFLYAPDVLRAELANFYNEVGVDPEAALKVKTSVLHDHREDRLELYRAFKRYQKYPADSNITGFAQVQELRTVGSANVGLVKFETESGTIRSVAHELLWYPMTNLELDEHQNPIALPLPRTDWVGTLHRAAWTHHEFDQGKT